MTCGEVSHGSRGRAQKPTVEGRCCGFSAAICGFGAEVRRPAVRLHPVRPRPDLLRLELARVAAEARVAPTRVTFVASVQRIGKEWGWLANTQAQGTIPQKLLALRAGVERFVLPPRRSERAYPRAVKIMLGNDPRKRPAAEKRGK